MALNPGEMHGIIAADRTAPPGNQVSSRKRRWRLTMGGLMLLIGVIGLSLGLQDHWSRIQIEIRNDSDQTMHEVIITDGTYQIQAEAIPPHQTWKHSMKFNLTGTVSASYVEPNPARGPYRVGIGGVGASKLRFGDVVYFLHGPHKSGVGARYNRRSWLSVVTGVFS